MKNIITKAFAIAMLTTAISAFADSQKAQIAKENDPNNENSQGATVTYVHNESKSHQDNTQQNKSDDNSRRQQQIEQQDKEWLHDTANLVAG